MMTHVDAEEGGHPVEVVGVVGHAQHLGHDGVLGPLGAKLLHQLHQVTGGRLADGIHYRRGRRQCQNMSVNATWHQFSNR